MGKKKTSKAWMQQHINDPYVRLAQQKGYRARAAFKLLQIIETEKLLHPGNIVVDLGSAPGSWSQVARERLIQNGQINGRIIALDMLPMEPIDDVSFILGDFREDEVLEQLKELLDGQQVDLVISDMAPNLSGVAAADSARIEHVVELAVDFAINHLKPDGALITKAFHGSGYSQLVKLFKEHFHQVNARKPKSSRDRSSETFLVGRQLKNASLR